MFAATVQSRAISDFRSPQSIRNRQSAIRNSRLGITLTEVLISLGILTIGLLGVAALFPVGSYYMQKGEIADRGSAIGQEAFNDLIARGMLNPANWLMMENGDSPWTAASSGAKQTYTKKFKDMLAQKLTALIASGNSKLWQNQYLNAKYGYAYVIDPLGVNGSATNTAIPPAQFRMVQQFPFFAKASTNYNQQPWKPWTVDPASTLLDPIWPLLRVTLPQSGTGVNGSPMPLTSAVADEVFRSRDDLALDVPSKSNQPSVQRWDTVDTDGDGKPDTPLARQSRGDYTWMATVVPPSSDARNALASDPSAFEYEVSVAVFYKRKVDDASSQLPQDERLVNAQVVSTGLNGGQLLLTQIDAAPSDPFVALKAGNWVAVCGPHPASTDDVNRFVFRWYRVLSIEGKDTKLDNYGKPGATDGIPRRLVSLRGPEWPWQPASDLSSYSDLSNYICVAIVPSVVAVHSKTIRLEGNSAWSIQ